jgi:predicted Zn-dependent protease
MRNFKKRQILLVPFNTIDKELINHLKKKIEEIIEYQVRVSAQSIPLPICRRRGDQLFANDLFPSLRKELLKAEADYVLGITDRDLYAENLNFIFSLAYSNLSVVSLNRLVSEDRELFYKRAVKESVHELGHVGGLAHCTNASCVMHFSNCLRDTDTKDETFCSKCQKNFVT